MYMNTTNEFILLWTESVSDVASMDCSSEPLEDHRYENWNNHTFSYPFPKVVGVVGWCEGAG